MRLTMTGARKPAVRFGLLLTAGVAAAVALWVIGVRAVFPDSDVVTYTGCLNTGSASRGIIVNVAIGDAPGQPCNSNQTVVHLSGGDITSVETAAGSGLSGGTDNGKAALRLDGTSCPNGGVLQWDALAGTWDCAAFTGSDFATSNQSCGFGDFVTGIDASGHLACSPESEDDVYIKSSNPDPGSPLTIAGGADVISLDVPAGSFFITAKMYADNPHEGPTERLTCTLSTGDSVGIWLSGWPELNNHEWIVLQDAATLDTPTQITVHCDAGDLLTLTNLHGISIAAVRVNGIHVQ